MTLLVIGVITICPKSVIRFSLKGFVGFLLLQSPGRVRVYRGLFQDQFYTVNDTISNINLQEN